MKIIKNMVLILLSLIIIIGCTHKTPYTNRSQMIFMSNEEELALGEKSYQEALAESKVITATCRKSPSGTDSKGYCSRSSGCSWTGIG